MTVERYAASYSTAIQQRITSGQHFDGTLPVADSVIGGNGSIYKYPIASAGGLFYWNASESIVISQFHVDLGGSGNVSLYIVNLDDDNAVISGESILIEQATAATFVALDEARFKTVLLPKQALQLITTNSSNPQIAQAVGSLERTFIR